jgi:hypothetical protein
VREPILFDCISQGSGDVSLADEIIKRLWTIFPRENLVAHAPNLIRFNRARKQKREKRRFVNRRSMGLFTR